MKRDRQKKIYPNDIETEPSAYRDVFNKKYETDI